MVVVVSAWFDPELGVVSAIIDRAAGVGRGSSSTTDETYQTHPLSLPIWCWHSSPAYVHKCGQGRNAAVSQLQPDPPTYLHVRVFDKYNAVWL